MSTRAQRTLSGIWYTGTLSQSAIRLPDHRNVRDLLQFTLPNQVTRFSEYLLVVTSNTHSKFNKLKSKSLSRFCSLKNILGTNAGGRVTLPAQLKTKPGSSWGSIFPPQATRTHSLHSSLLQVRKLKAYIWLQVARLGRRGQCHGLQPWLQGSTIEAVWVWVFWCLVFLRGAHVCFFVCQHFVFLF